MFVGYIHLKHFEYVQNINVTYRKIIHRNLAGWNKLFEDYNSWEVLTAILMSFYFMSEMRWGFVMDFSISESGGKEGVTRGSSLH